MFIELPINLAAPWGPAAAEPLCGHAHRILERGVCVQGAHLELRVCVPRVWLHTAPRSAPNSTSCSGPGRGRGGPGLGNHRQLWISQIHQNNFMENWENHAEGREKCNHLSLLENVFLVPGHCLSHDPTSSQPAKCQVKELWLCSSETWVRILALPLPAARAYKEVSKPP